MNQRSHLSSIYRRYYKEGQMNKKEFINKYHLTDRNKDLLTFLDRLYLEFPYDQAQSMIEDYFSNANEIFNGDK